MRMEFINKVSPKGTEVNLPLTRLQFVRNPYHNLKENNSWTAKFDGFMKCLVHKPYST